MNPEIKVLWVKALRSGKYRQGKHTLGKPGRCAAHGAKFCCMGVLCELAVDAGIIERKVILTSQREEIYEYGGRSVFVPVEVEVWAGLQETNPLASQRTLAKHNDKGESFSSIAEIIDANL